MKTNRCHYILFVISIILIFGCGSPKPLRKVTGAVEIKIPFSEDKYKTDINAFRAVQSALGEDISIAKDIAFLAAKGELTTKVETVISSVRELYNNQRRSSSNLEFEQKFESKVLEVVNQKVNDVRIIDEKAFKEVNGNYTYWIAIELSKKEVKEKIINEVSKDKKLQLDFDKYQFDKIFEKEMEKFLNRN